jgi:hypothetical protein
MRIEPKDEGKRTTANDRRLSIITHFDQQFEKKTLITGLWEGNDHQ